MARSAAAVARIVGVDAEDVGQHHLLGVLRVAGLEPARVADAGVGEDDVDPAVLVERARSTSASTWAYSVTSHWTAIPPVSSASCSSLSSERAPSTTR